MIALIPLLLLGRPTKTVYVASTRPFIGLPFQFELSSGWADRTKTGTPSIELGNRLRVEFETAADPKGERAAQVEDLWRTLQGRAPEHTRVRLRIPGGYVVVACVLPLRAQHEAWVKKSYDAPHFGSIYVEHGRDIATLDYEGTDPSAFSDTLAVAKTLRFR